MKEEVTILKNEISYWWFHLLIGILFLGMGIWVIATPLASYLGLSILFSILMFISGVFELAFAISNKGKIKGWGWYMTVAIIDFIVGLLLVIYPTITMTILPILVAIWILFKGIAVIGSSNEMKRFGIKGRGWLMGIGVISILFAVSIIIHPMIGIWSIVYLTAFALISIGIFRITLAFRLRELSKRMTEGGEK